MKLDTGTKFIGKIITVVIWLFLLENKVISQSNIYEFRQISLEQGLPGTNTRVLFQDHNGIMWISVEAMGLCRYEGHKFTLFRNDPSNNQSISSNFINHIAEDKKGNLWIATAEGLNLFNRETRTFSRFYCDPQNYNSISDNVVNTIYTDIKGNVWVGTGNGISVLKSGSNTFRRYLFNNVSDINNTFSIFSIFEQNNGVFWIGTNQGLLKFYPESGKFTHWKKKGKTSNEPVHNQISQVKEDKYGNLWLATHRGLDRFNITTEQFTHWKYLGSDIEDLSQEGINTIFINSDSSVWVGTYTKGIVIIDPNKNTYTRIRKDDLVENPIRSNHILFIQSDNTGIIWIGTKFGGLFKFIGKEGIFQLPSTFRIFEKLVGKHILSFYSDKNDVFWVGSKFEGLYKVDRKMGKIENFRYTLNNKKSLASNRIQSVLRDSKDNLWIGTETGLDRFDENHKTFIHIGNTPVNYMAEDNLGTIWIGTTSGIFVLNKTRTAIERYNTSQFKEFFMNVNLDVLYILKDQKNHIWFSTRYNGLYRYHPGLNEFHHYIKEEKNSKGLSDNMVRPIFEDKSGTIWIGTKAGGLQKFDWKTENFTKYTVNDGLPSNFILGIEHDKNGFLWLGTNNGLSKFDPIKKTSINFNKDNGLHSNIIELGVSGHFPTGELLYGGNDGFNIFLPSNIKKTDKNISCVVTSVNVFDKQITSDITRQKNLVLKYYENYVSFEYTLTDFNNPFKHQYYCYLEGIDKNWINMGNRNYVAYTNLEPGIYYFRVKGVNELGNWTKNQVIIKIEIKPAYYETWWFRILFLLVVILLIATFYYRKAHKIKNTQELLERQIKERTYKLEDANKELLQKNRMIEEQKKEIENHRISLEKIVHERTKDLEIAKERAEEADRLKSSFLANMSHEIRTPLNAITGFSMLLNDSSLHAKTRDKYLQIINVNTKSLLKLIEDILDISKIESGQLTLNNEIFDLHSILLELTIIFQEELRIHKKELLQLKCTNNLVNVPYLPVYTDPFRFKQLWIDLISNAIKYTNEGEISFGFTIINKDIQFFIKDTGIGISEKDQEKIFNRFVKVEENTTAYRGTGIGLSIVKSLVDMMGGKIWIESELNQGSCFFIYLPNLIVSTYTPENKIYSPEISNISFKNISILIVDDEESNLQLLFSFFNKTGAKIHEAVNGKAAIEICRKEKIDIVLLDIKMPVMNGFDAIKIIRNDRPDLPVIAQTAYAMAEDQKRILKAGFNDYISKPIDRELLFEKINFLIKK